ncbi:MAG TPA: hypothetical protein VFD70_28840 [Anaerolineae bacterium]|nr:hypothetical protein [Anaerolineae bacterium]
MQLRIAALADYTNITGNGKLNILGIFSQIYADNVPVTHSQMQFVVQLAFEPIEVGDKKIRIVLQDADAREILALDGMLNIQKQDSPDPVVVNQILVLQNVVFPHYGSYEFVIEVDGETLPAHVPLDVLPTPATASQ